MYIVKTEDSFDAAHFLANYQGKCRNIHGHRWKVVVEAAGKTVDEGGMVIDFTDLKRSLKSLTDTLDHALIVQEGSLRPATIAALREEDFRMVMVDFRPTAENFARYFFDLLKSQYPLRAVEVYETPKNCARYEEV